MFEKIKKMFLNETVSLLIEFDDIFYSDMIKKSLNDCKINYCYNFGMYIDDDTKMYRYNIALKEKAINKLKKYYKKLGYEMVPLCENNGCLKKFLLRKM